MTIDAPLLLIALLIAIRIITLSAERVAFHGLGQGGYGALPTMGIAFWGASGALWLTALWQHEAFWVGSTMLTGAVYAVAFGLYTASLAEGPVGSVSAWTNATVVLLWIVQPTGGVWSVLAIAIFGFGAWLLTGNRLSRAVLWMVLSDFFFVVARLMDAARTDAPPFAYAASVFTSISAWMTIPILLTGNITAMWKLAKKEPGWSFISATSNAAAYLCLFLLFNWLPPAIVEAVSVVAGLVSTLGGIFLFKETDGRRKLIASTLMTIAVCVLLFDHLSMID